MGKKFKIITNAVSNEVSLCTKYNSGANKQTQFELVKNKELANNSSMKEVLQKFIDMCGEIEQPCCAFHDFLSYWMQYDIDNTYYNLLSDALRAGISEIQYADMPKDEKEGKFKELFDMFIEEFNKMPISKTKDGKYEVSLVTKSHIKDEVAIPQNETEEITTKEKTSTMEKTEEMNIVEKAIETIVTALGLKKTETPADETPEVKTEEVVEETAQEETVETETTEEVVEEEPAVEETPVVEEAEVVEKTETTEEVVEEVETTNEAQEEAKEEVQEEIAKTSDITSEIEELKKQKLDVENELAELKKANEEKEIAIEKMSFVQKAKDEFSMLVGTPEEIGATLYSISKSNLQDTEKEFILEQFKKVSKENKELTQELGSITKNAGDMTEEDMVYAKAEEIAKSKGISIKKALREVK